MAATGGASNDDGDDETPKLPQEIVAFDILTRLPVKSLLKFRCVSKPWCSSISSPSFVKSHLQASQSSINHKFVVCVCVKSPRFTLKLRHVPLRSFLIQEPSQSSIDAIFPGRRCLYSRVVGTHNGLICISIDNRDLFVWNPATRVRVELPTFKLNLLPAGFKESSNTFGFGYSNATEEYKVVRITRLIDDVGNFESLVNIYSQKSDSWKTLDGCKIGIPLESGGRFLNGKLHFATAMDFDFEVQFEIVSFDLGSESYGMLEQPDYGKDTFEISLGCWRAAFVLFEMVAILRRVHVVWICGF